MIQGGEGMYNIAFIGGGVNSAIGRSHYIAAQMDGKFKLVAGAFSRHAEINLETVLAYCPSMSTMTTK